MHSSRRASTPGQAQARNIKHLWHPIDLLLKVADPRVCSALSLIQQVQRLQRAQEHSVRVCDEVVGRLDGQAACQLQQLRAPRGMN